MKVEPFYREAHLLDIWEQIGQRNYWIRQAIDPPFDKTQLIKCDTLEDLQLSLQQTAWCLGQGFYYQQLCFINQISGGDEWLTIKDDYAFESISFARVIEAGKFEGLIERLLKASKDQCLRLRYSALKKQPAVKKEAYKLPTLYGSLFISASILKPERIENGPIAISGAFLCAF